LKLASGQFSSPKISASTAVLKQTKEVIDPLLIFELGKASVIKTEVSKRTIHFVGKIKIDSFIFHLENIFSIYLPKVIWYNYYVIPRTFQWELKRIGSSLAYMTSPAGQFDTILPSYLRQVSVSES
jgi:hypothetical protein